MNSRSISGSSLLRWRPKRQWNFSCELLYCIPSYVLSRCLIFPNLFERMLLLVLEEVAFRCEDPFCGPSHFCFNFLFITRTLICDTLVNILRRGLSPLSCVYIRFNNDKNYTEFTSLHYIRSKLNKRLEKIAEILPMVVIINELFWGGQTTIQLTYRAFNSNVPSCWLFLPILTTAHTSRGCEKFVRTSGVVSRKTTGPSGVHEESQVAPPRSFTGRYEEERATSRPGPGKGYETLVGQKLILDGWKKRRGRRMRKTDNCSELQWKVIMQFSTAFSPGFSKEFSSPHLYL